MAKNNDGRLDHYDPIGLILQNQVFIEYLILFSYLCSYASEQYLHQILMPQIQCCLLTQRRKA